jgi:surface antigen
VPVRSFADGGGRTCREVTQIIRVRGRLETGTGVACRSTGGSWQLIP